jgi:ribosomal-protein-alanine N-acetyltransferase
VNDESDISVRFAEPEYLCAMEKIYTQSFYEFQPKCSIEQYLLSPRTWALIAFVRIKGGNIPAGYVLARNAADEAEILSIGVAPTFRKRGVGSALLTKMEGIAHIRGARSIFLEVGIYNQNARALYSKAGYQVIGQRPNYYKKATGKRVTALVLHKNVEK